MAMSSGAPPPSMGMVMLEDAEFDEPVFAEAEEIEFDDTRSGSVPQTAPTANYDDLIA